MGGMIEETHSRIAQMGPPGTATPDTGRQGATHAVEVNNVTDLEQALAAREAEIATLKLQVQGLEKQLGTYMSSLSDQLTKITLETQKQRQTVQDMRNANEKASLVAKYKRLRRQIEHFSEELQGASCEDPISDVASTVTAGSDGGTVTPTASTVTEEEDLN
ncbi:hypothetical protein EDC01DRAFT_209027 [Geopyxis carbonaria]|nr:hypothetical protein EDC01DRAFT_209027 [Geopyxis carbonaria]